MFFCFAFKNTGICSVLCISGPKSIGIYSIFCVFAWLPQKTLKRKNAIIYSILSISKSWKSSEKCVKTALFSDFRYPQNGMGEVMLLETLMSDPDSVQKSPLRDFQLLVWGLRLDLRSLTVALKASNTQGQHFTSVAFRAVANTSRSQALQSQHVLRHTSLA